MGFIRKKLPLFLVLLFSCLLILVVGILAWKQRPDKEELFLEEQGQVCQVSGHDFMEGIWESPTCTKKGYYHNICQNCGLVESVTQEALPHETEDVVVQEGNCMNDTVIRYVCKTCGLQTEEETRFTPDIHNWVKAILEDEEVTYCTWCGCVR